MSDPTRPRRRRTVPPPDRAERLRRRLTHPLFPVTVGHVADRDALYAAYRFCAAEGGPGPGPDGVRVRDLSPGEVGDLVGCLAADLADRRYRPGPTRTVDVPKAAGATGTRRLRLANLPDRVVARAVLDALTPVFEPAFLPSSCGFRPGLGAWNLFARLERGLTAGRPVVWADDVRTAFDRLPVGAVVEQFDARLARLADSAWGPAVLAEWTAIGDWYGWLVRQVLGAGTTRRGVGLAQGNALSTLGLNAAFHAWLDVPLAAMIGEPHWHRYADNLVAAVRCVSEGEEVARVVRDRLASVGLEPKGPSVVADLGAGERAELLGLSVRLDGDRVVYQPGRTAEDQLRLALLRAHEGDDPPAAAVHAVAGWVASLGPALESVDGGTVERWRAVAAGCGFREGLSRDVLLTAGRASYQRWRRFRGRAGASPSGRPSPATHSSSGPPPAAGSPGG